ncbi:MAG: 23S rRNA (pseudouridine(1915)-N(3))-methyltransferase RlmH [Pseudomonadota bacterium]
MQIEILVVGRMKAGPERELYNRYSDRIARSGRSLHLTGPNLIEISESKADDVRLRKQDESHQLLSKVERDTHVILLDENGKDCSSRQFASLISSEQQAGTTSLAFAIGGPDGHGEEMRNRAIRSIRFGSMTWPHQLARVMLTEQIYRAITILSGHPYHRE